MNRRTLINTLGLAPLALISSKITSFDSIVAHLIKRWKKSEEYTLAVFNTMPSAEIEFRPSKEQFSFAQHFLHLAFINVTYFGVLMDSKTYKDIYALLEADFIIPPPDGIDVFQPDTLKAGPSEENAALVSRYVSQTYAYVLSSLNQLEDAQLTAGLDKEKPEYLSGHTYLDLIIRGEAHTAHHRAQAIAYLRMKGIRPPGYSINNKF